MKKLLLRFELILYNYKNILLTKLSYTILEFKQYQDFITTIGLHKNIENRMTSDVLKLFKCCLAK